jgi:hypothetical protein
MALEGNLSSFGLAEILQLIAVQQKTGMLTVSEQNNTTVMFFRNGKIISTRDRRRKSVDTFKDYLTRYGVLKRDDLIRISQISAQSKLDLIEIIESEKLLSTDDLQKHFHNQIQESMHDVLSWEQCTYKFITNDNIIKNVKSVGEYNIEAMLMESMRRIDEFPQLLEMFPNDNILVSRTKRTCDDVASEDMTTNEKTILDLLGVKVSLRDLIATAKMTLFEVYEALKHLKDKDLICFKDALPEASDENAPQAAPKTSPRPRVNVLPLLLALVLFSLSLFVGGRGFVEDLETHRSFTTQSLQKSSIARNQVAEKLRWVIEAYRAQHGVYPPSLEALQSAGLATPRILEEAEAFSFRYRLTPGRPAYTLQ